MGGDSTTAATAMCIIHDLSYLEMTLNVDELQILSMQVGQNVQIRADAIPDQTFNGVVTNVSLGGHHHQRHHHLPGHHPDRRLRPAAARDERHRRDRGGQRPGCPLHPQCRRDPRQLCAGDRRLPQRSQRRDGYDRPRWAMSMSGSGPASSDDDYIQVLEGLEEGDTVAYDASSVSSSGYGAMGMQVTVSGG